MGVETKNRAQIYTANKGQISIWTYDPITGTYSPGEKIDTKDFFSTAELTPAGIELWQNLLKVAIKSDKLNDLTNSNAFTQATVNGVYSTSANTSNLPDTNKVGILECIVNGTTRYLRYTTLNNSKIEVWLNYYNGSTWQNWGRELDNYATKAYAESLVTGLWDDRGNYNASGNTFPATGGSGTAGAILKGDIWTISVGGTLGGVAVIAGQTVRAIVDSPGQTAGNWAISVGSSEISFATENEMQTGTSITKAVNVLGWMHGFVYHITNKAFDTLNTTSKFIIGAINELKSAIDLKLSDAPNDTDTYGRKGGAWSKIVSGLPALTTASFWVGVLNVATEKTIALSKNLLSSDASGNLGQAALSSGKVWMGNASNVPVETNVVPISVSVGDFTGAYAGLVTESNWANNVCTSVSGTLGDRREGTGSIGCSYIAEYTQGGWVRTYIDRRITLAALISALQTSSNWASSKTFNAASGDLDQQYVDDDYIYNCVDGTIHTWYREDKTSNSRTITDASFFPYPQIEVSVADNSTFTIPAKTDITAIMVEAETTTPGNISIGSADGLSDIVAFTALPTTIGNKKQLVYIVNPDYPNSSSRTMYVNISSAATVKLHVINQKMFA